MYSPLVCSLSCRIRTPIGAFFALYYFFQAEMV